MIPPRLRRMLALFLLVNSLLLLWGWTRAHRPDTLKITFLDVGQGDCAVIESPSGKTLVVDTGGISHAYGNAPAGEEAGSGDDQGQRILVPFLQSEGRNHVDVVLLTHPHADHIGGAATLLKRLDVDMVLDNGEHGTSRAGIDSSVVTDYLTVAHDRRVPCKAAQSGQSLDFGDGVTADILAPTPDAANGPVNDASIVLRVRYGRTAFLFTGDAEAGEEADVLGRLPDALACDVLKVGHHGSRTSTTPEFLERAHPKLAVVSVGTHNLYGHPNSGVLSRLADAGAQVFRTDRDGAITVTSDGVTVHAEAMHPHTTP